MQAVALAQTFQQQFKKKYNYYPFSMKNVQESKWWKFFSEYADSSLLNDGREAEFISELFKSWENENTEKMYPYVLSTPMAKKNEEYIIEQSNIQVSSSLSEDDYIRMTIDKAKRWAKFNNVTNNILGRFILDGNCMLRASRGEFYKPIFLFSRTFINRYGITEEETLKKQSLKTFHPEVYDILKRSLLSEFID